MGNNSIEFLRPSKDVFMNYEQQAQSVRQYKAALARLTGVGYLKKTKKELVTNLRVEFSRCRQYLGNKRSQQTLKKAERTIEKQIKQSREQERLDLALAFIGY